MKTTPDPGPLTVDPPPTVEEALERLAGRRATAIEQDARVTVVKQNVGQNRHTRRNNLRLARAEAKKRRRDTPPFVATVLRDEDGIATFEKHSLSDETAAAVMGISVEDLRKGVTAGTVTVTGVGRGEP